ncbi:MAG: type II secretion system secretin GspD [Hyphomicrobiaceae bacterium]|nr:type II secretion system secretin GspD [Hyphomicrobiaceae bacterium]
MAWSRGVAANWAWGQSAFCAASACLLAACALIPAQLELPDPPPPDATTRIGGTDSGWQWEATREGQIVTGSDRFTDYPQPRQAAAEIATRDGVSLNLVGASAAEAAKTVLGDLLRVNYLVSEKIKATITIQTSRPVSREAVLDIFEAVLRAEGAAIVVDRGLYKVLPLEDALAAGAPMLPRGASGRNSAGLVTQIVPLRHVSAAEMDRIIRSMAPQLIVLKADEARNQLIIAGTRNEIASTVDIVQVFDVDWMRGMSFGIFPVESADPEAVAQDLDAIFANDRDGPTKGIVRFVPNRRLKSVLVISSRAEYIERAEQWLRRIELTGQATEKQVFVYQVRNRPALELAQLLQRVYSSQEQARVSTASTANGGRPAASSIDVETPGAGLLGALLPSAQPAGPSPPAVGGNGGQGPAAPPAVEVGSAFEAQLPGDDRASGISVVADETNNALVITATQSEYRRLRKVLESVDVAASQVLLEATIAEVTLNDNLKFGLRWFFERGQSQFRLSEFGSIPPDIDLPSKGILSPFFPGFSYFLDTPNVKLTLNALSEITDVNVVSSPSMMVLDNKKAVLQVGDEVPIAVQQAAGVLTAFPLVNTIAFRNTGVILGITPRIGEDGRVLLEIEQEVSDAVRTTTSQIDSPTIQQRRIKTTVVVRDGESIVLAGMMQDRSTLGRSQVPLFGDIPIVGNLFKQKDDSIERTELLIAITPRLVKDTRRIREITAEFRDRLNFRTRPHRFGPPDRREQVDRLAR